LLKSSEVVVIREESLPENANGLKARMRRAAEELGTLEQDLAQIVGTGEVESAALLSEVWDSSIIPDLAATCKHVRSLLWAYFLQLMRRRTESTDVRERSTLSARAKAVLDQIERLSRIVPDSPRVPKEAA